MGRAGRYLKIVSPLAIALGLASTLTLFLLGLTIGGGCRARVDNIPNKRMGVMEG
jgi:hypothetical protein